MTSPTTNQNGTARDLVTSDPFKEIGVTGVVQYGGVIDDDELLEWRGLRKQKTIRQMMMNDATIGGLLFAIRMLIRQVDWRVEDGAEDSESVRAGELVRTALFRDMSMSWKDTLSDIVSFLPWGWELSEIVYKHRDGDSLDPSRRSRFSDGLIGWRKWPIRSQETLESWIMDDRGGIRGMRQYLLPSYQVADIPLEKALLFRTESNRGNPEGISILRTAYRPWKLKTGMENLEAIGVERDTAGLPVAYLPPEYMSTTATAAQQTIFNYTKKLVQNIRNNDQGGIVMPMAYDANGKQSFDIKLLSAAGAKQFDTDKIVNRYDHRILMSVLADFLMLGAEKVGSFALSDDKTDIFAVATGAWLDSIAGVVNQYAIPRLLTLNGMRPPELPMLTHGDIESPNLVELGDYISKMMTVGAMTYDPGLEQFVRKAANLPQLPEDTGGATG